MWAQRRFWTRIVQTRFECRNFVLARRTHENIRLRMAKKFNRNHTRQKQNSVSDISVRIYPLMLLSTAAVLQRSAGKGTREKLRIHPGRGVCPESGGKKAHGRKMPGKLSLASSAKMLLVRACTASFLMYSRKSGLCAGATTNVRRASRAIGLQLPRRSFHTGAACQHLLGVWHVIHGAVGS